MTKTTARHRAPLTARGRLTRTWSTVSALPVGALAGCVAVGAAAGTGTPVVGALGLVALVPAAVAGWRSRLTDPAHGRRSARRPGVGPAGRPGEGSAARQGVPQRAVTVRLAALLEPATTGHRARSLPPMVSAPRLARPAPPVPSSRASSPFGPARARPMLALGTSPVAVRTPIVLDVPDLAALQLATGQEAVWHGRTHVAAESDPSRLFTVSSARGTVEVVVLTRAERAARDLAVLATLEAAQTAPADGGQGGDLTGSVDRADPTGVVAEITTRPRPGAPRREDGGMASAA